MVGTLRRTVDVVSVLAAAGLIAFISIATSDRMREKRDVESVASDVARFQQVLSYRAAANQAEVNQRGWPITVDPQWFNGDPPRNVLVSPERPWVEVATPAEATLNDPPMRMTINPKLASFWYNPYQGIVRARVPVSISDAKALSLYNSINGTHLSTIYAPEALEQPAQAGSTGSTSASGASGQSGAPASTSGLTASAPEETGLEATPPQPKR